MLDVHLSALYGVSTKRLNEAVSRNLARFPSDFMFRLTVEEIANLRSQIATSSWGGRRYLPYAFTEQGVAMLSGVLRSERAIQVNVAIMRAFVHMRETLALQSKLARRLDELEARYIGHDQKLEKIFAALRELMEPEYRPSRQIGFKP